MSKRVTRKISQLQMQQVGNYSRKIVENESSGLQNLNNNTPPSLALSRCRCKKFYIMVEIVPKICSVTIKTYKMISKMHLLVSIITSKPPLHPLRCHNQRVEGQNNTQNEFNDRESLKNDIHTPFIDIISFQPALLPQTQQCTNSGQMVTKNEFSNTLNLYGMTAHKSHTHALVPKF